MLNLFFFIFCSFSMLQSNFAFSENPNREGIRWQTNFEDAVKQSKASSKPLVLFFTGSDWCSWCNKIEAEAFNNPDFSSAIDNKFIFVKLDYPLYTSQDPQLKAQNKQLQQRFAIRSFPTVILFDGKNNQQIGVTGYKPGGGKQYADYLLKMYNEYSAYKQKITTLESTKYSGSELKNLYEKAKELNLHSDANKIVFQGIVSDDSLYFLVERYRSLAKEGKIQDSEAVNLKQRLLLADPSNEKEIPYQLAVIEFETCCEEMERDSYSPEFAIAPLKAYMEKFGSTDKENLWRLQMIISQVYLDKNQMTTALKYAQASYETAPLSVQPEIARAIQNIRSQIHSSLTTQVSQK